MSRPASTFLALLLLGGVILAVHGPGLTAAPRWDLTQYFVERQAWPTFTQALQRLDYSLARRYWKGDEGEYRPLLFLLVATEYGLFGVDMRGWHATSIGLHVFVAFLLYRLVAASHSRDLALLLSILFGVLFASTGLVAEPWVGGYLAGCALLLVALQDARARIRRDQVPEATHWLLYSVCLTLAGFFLEVFVVFSLVLAVCFWVQLRRQGARIPGRVAALWLAPALVFSVFYVPRALIAPRLLFIHDLSSSYLLAPEHLAVYPRRVVEFFLLWSVSTLAPTIPPFFPVFFGGYVPLRWLSRIAAVVNVCLVVGILVILWRHARPALSRHARWNMLCIACLLTAYTAVLRFGRDATDETHLYIFALLAVLMLGTLLERPGLVARARLAMMSLLAALAVLNAGLSQRLASRNGREGAEVVRYLSALDRFVRTHGQEPGFSFSIEPNPSFAEVTLLEEYPDKPARVTETWLYRTFPGAVSDPASAAYSLKWNGLALEVERGPARRMVPKDGIEPSRGVSPTGF